MKKKTAWIRRVALCLLIPLFGACGRESKQEEDTGEQYATISLYSDVNFWKMPEWDTSEGTITGEITKQTGVTVDAEIPVKEADTRLKLMLLEDELPDVMCIVDSTALSQLVTSGKVWKIDEFLEKYKPDSHLLTEFPEDVRHELIKRDGGWYALPSHINSDDAREIWPPCDPYWDDAVLYAENNAIIWNKDLLEKLGVRIEGTVAQDDIFAVLEQAKKSGLTVDGEPIIPFLPDGNDYQGTTLRFLLGNFGAERIDEDGHYCDQLRQPEAKEMLRFLNQAVRRGYIDPEDFKLESSQVQELSASGRVLCFVGNIADFAATEEGWTSTGVVRSDSGSVPVLGRNRRATTGWIQTLVSRDCENPEKIAEWIDYMTSDEGRMLWHYGFPGEDYTVGDDGQVHRTEAGKAKEAAFQETGLTAYWMFANTTWSRSKTVEGENNGELALAFGKYKETVIYDDSLLMFPADLFAQDSEAQKMEQGIAAWKDTQLLAVILAQSDGAFEAEYDKLMQGLLSRGIERTDALRDEAYQENCKEYGSRIEKVNRHEGDGE